MSPVKRQSLTGGRMKATSSLFSSKEFVTGFMALSVRLSSKSQLLQKVPGQRIWKVTFIFDLGWEPCKQACPQKQTSAKALFAKIPTTRNMTTNMLNFWRYTIKVLPSNLRVFFLCRNNYTSTITCINLEYRKIHDFLYYS